MHPPVGRQSSVRCVYANQRRIKKRHGGVTKTTTPAGVENKVATRPIRPASCEFDLVINLVFFMSFFKKRLK